jgi:hypothetical protein
MKKRTAGQTTQDDDSHETDAFILTDQSPFLVEEDASSRDTSLSGAALQSRMDFQVALSL